MRKNNISLIKTKYLYLLFIIWRKKKHAKWRTIIKNMKKQMKESRSMLKLDQKDQWDKSKSFLPTNA